MMKLIDSYEPFDTLGDYFEKVFKEVLEIISDKCKDKEDYESNILDLLNKENNVAYVQRVGLNSLIKNYFMKDLETTTLSDIKVKYLIPIRKSNSLADLYSKSTEHLEVNPQYFDDVYEKIKIFINAVLVIFIARGFEITDIDKPDEEVTNILEESRLPKPFSKEQIDTLQNLLFSILKKSEFQIPFIKDEIALYIIRFYAAGAKQMDLVEEFKQNLGILDNEHIVLLRNYLKAHSNKIDERVEKAIHDLMNTDELFEKMEKESISRAEKEILRPEDYVYRFLQNYHLKRTCEFNPLEKLKVTTITDMYKTGEISFDDLYILLTAPESRFSKCDSKDKKKLISEIRKTFNFRSEEDSKEYYKNFRSFRAEEYLELTKLGLVSDEDMLSIYITFKLRKEQELEIHKSSQLYDDQQQDNISDDKVKEHFTLKRLLDTYFKSNNINSKEFNFILTCYNSFYSVDEIEEYILNDERIKPQDIIFFHQRGIIKNSVVKLMKENDDDFKQEVFNHIGKIDDVEDIINYFNSDILTEEDLIEIFDDEDEYVIILREAFRKRYIALDKLDDLVFLDHAIVMEEYNKSLAGHLANPETEKEELNFECMLELYLWTDGLVYFEDIYNMINDKKEAIFRHEDFDIREYIYHIISVDAKEIEGVETIDQNIIISKIKELYMKRLLTYDKLNKLAEEGVIDYSQAKKIDDEFNCSERVSKLKKIRLGESDSLIPSQTNNHPHKPYNKRPTDPIQKQPSEKQKAQAITMIEYLESLGFSPITSTNVYGLEKIQTFSSGDFKDYGVFLSDKLPVVILHHLKQIPNTDTYYHVGDNATYIMALAEFYNLLDTMGGILDNKLSFLGTTKSDARESQYTRRANVGKRWPYIVPRKIGQIINMFEEPELRKVLDKKFQVESLLPGELTSEERIARLSIIEECIEEVNNAREMPDEEK